MDLATFSKSRSRPSATSLEATSRPSRFLAVAFFLPSSPSGRGEGHLLPFFPLNFIQSRCPYELRVIRRHTAIVMALTLWNQSSVWGGGFEGSGIGPKALSMGGAFVGLADDWTAAFWNPAGLAFLNGWGVGQSVDLISLRALDGNSIANPTPPLSQANIEQGDPFVQFGGEPSRFGITDTSIQAA